MMKMKKVLLALSAVVLFSSGVALGDTFAVPPRADGELAAVEGRASGVITSYGKRNSGSRSRSRRRIRSRRPRKLRNRTKSAPVLRSESSETKTPVTRNEEGKLSIPAPPSNIPAPPSNAPKSVPGSSTSSVSSSESGSGNSSMSMEEQIKRAVEKRSMGGSKKVDEGKSSGSGNFQSQMLAVKLKNVGASNADAGQRQESAKDEQQNEILKIRERLMKKKSAAAKDKKSDKASPNIKRINVEELERLDNEKAEALSKVEPVKVEKVVEEEKIVEEKNVEPVVEEKKTESVETYNGLPLIRQFSMVAEDFNVPELEGTADATKAVEEKVVEEKNVEPVVEEKKDEPVKVEKVVEVKEVVEEKKDEPVVEEDGEVKVIASTDASVPPAPKLDRPVVFAAKAKASEGGVEAQSRKRAKSVDSKPEESLRDGIARLAARGALKKVVIDDEQAEHKRSKSAPVQSALSAALDKRRGNLRMHEQEEDDRSNYVTEEEEDDDDLTAFDLEKLFKERKAEFPVYLTRDERNNLTVDGKVALYKKRKKSGDKKGLEVAKKPEKEEVKELEAQAEELEAEVKKLEAEIKLGENGIPLPPSIPAPPSIPTPPKAPAAPKVVKDQPVKRAKSAEPKGSMEDEIKLAKSGLKKVNKKSEEEKKKEEEKKRSGSMNFLQNALNTAIKNRRMNLSIRDDADDDEEEDDWDN